MWILPTKLAWNESELLLPWSRKSFIILWMLLSITQGLSFLESLLSSLYMKIWLTEPAVGFLTMLSFVTLIQLNLQKWKTMTSIVLPWCQLSKRKLETSFPTVTASLYQFSVQVKLSNQSVRLSLRKENRK